MKIFNFTVKEKGTPYIWRYSCFADSEQEAKEICLNVLSRCTRKPTSEFEITECTSTECE